MLALAGGAQAQDLLGQAADWKASASDQVKAELRRDARGICLDYDFRGVSGYAVLRRALPLDWPAHWRLASEWQGQGGRNDVQLKFADASGDNVWWINRPNEQLPAQYAPRDWKPRHLQFAWGPTADKRLRQTAFVEWVIAAGRDGGKGSACLRKLQLQQAEAPPASWPEPRRSQVGARVLQWELGGQREFNGLLLHWPKASGLDYEIEASRDGRRWQRLRTVRGGAGGVAALFLPEQEARSLRLRLTQGDAALLRDLHLEPRDATQWPTQNAVLAEQAKSLPRSLLPRAFHGEQNYWALVGVDGGGDRSGLINEDGEIELGRGAPSVAPLLQLEDGALIGWSEVQTRHSLPEGQLPLPTVHWQHPRFALDIQAGADGSPDAPQLLAHYRVTNRGSTPLRARLLLLLRPWQVNPPQQFLSTQGGSSAVAELAWRDGRVWLNGRASLKPQQTPTALRAAPLDAGLQLPQLPLQNGFRDPQQLASLLLEFPVELAPGATQSFAWAAPLAGDAQPVGDVSSRLSRAEARWRERLSGVQVEGPPAMQPVIDSLRMAQAHILMSRQGPALRPGTRSYARTWIRDGAMMVAGLTRLGELQVARDFVDWFAPQVFASGKVPCCIDQRGADPVVENDSHGQFIYSVAEVWRHSGDEAWLRSHWPRVRQVMAWMEAQRQKERAPAQPAHLFGLMPPSISHEGYSDKPAYSNWDNFWTLRGYKDAVQIAAALQARELDAWTAQRDEFAKELDASLRASSKLHGRDHLLGAADRGDFDPTSTTIALNPVQAQLPPALLAATFERYWQESQQRAAGTRQWKDYTPYELRGVGAFVQLGQRERAHELLDFFFRDQRPAGWKQWAEVVLPAYREPRFLGDMPHAWVASDYLRSALDFFAIEREAPQPLLLGAGLRASWLQAGDIAVRGLATARGPVDYALHRMASVGWQLQLRQSPPAALSWPEELPLPRAVHQGRELAWQGRELPLPPAPATVELMP